MDLLDRKILQDLHAMAHHGTQLSIFTSTNCVTYMIITADTSRLINVMIGGMSSFIAVFIVVSSKSGSINKRTHFHTPPRSAFVFIGPHHSPTRTSILIIYVVALNFKFHCLKLALLLIIIDYLKILSIVYSESC